MRSGEIGLIKTVLGILSLYRVLPCKGKEKLETITDKYSGLIPVLPLLEVDSLFRELFQPLRGKLPAGRKFLLNMKTAGPNFKPAILGAAADAYSHAQHRLLLYPIQVLSTFFESEIHNQLREEIHVVKNWKPLQEFKLGKLATKVEAAGKIRVFAILDVWSQSVLEPMHTHIFEILKRIPNDGCFDQLLPLDRLMKKGHKDIYSFDLSAATDRFPITLQAQLLTKLYNSEVANAWVSLLKNRDYHYKQSIYNYAVGQPMGALSSWGVFSLTHHFVVQYCARQAGWKTWFDEYALLGDDIVIANKQVADIYLFTMTKVFGVEINISKSLISNNGTAEFAKHLVTRDCNYTPVGPKNVSQSLRTFANFPSLLRDFISKGGFVGKSELEKLFNTLSYDIVKVSKKNLTSLLWVLIGPFGFINTRVNVGIGQVLPAEYSITPYSMKMRNLTYALDWLIVPIKEAIRKDYHKAWEQACDKTSSTIWAYRNLTTAKGFESTNLSVVVRGDIRSLDLADRDIFKLPSYRGLLLSSAEALLDLTSKEVPELNWPYSLSFEDGLIYMLKNIKFPTPEDNCLVQPRVERPRYRQTNINFFKEVRKNLVNLLHEHEVERRRQMEEDDLE